MSFLGKGVFSTIEVETDQKKHGKPVTRHVLKIDAAIALGEVSEWIRSGDHRFQEFGVHRPLAQITGGLRECLAREGRDSSPFKRSKERLPTIVPASAAGTAILVSKATASDGFHNRLYSFDIDLNREDMDLDAIRGELLAAPGCVLVAVSSSGDALYAFFAGPIARLNAIYKQNWLRIRDSLPALSKASTAQGSDNPNRLRFVCHDPSVWLAPSVTPLHFPHPTGHARNSRAAVPYPSEYELDRQALFHIPAPVDSNAWLGWLGTLKALGFPIEIVDAWNSSSPNYKPGAVAKRWDRAPVDDPEDARNKLRGHATNLGWEAPFKRRHSSNGDTRTQRDTWADDGIGDAEPLLVFVQDGEARPVVLTDRQSYAEPIGQALPNYGVAYYTGDLAAVDLNPLNDRPVTVWHGQGADYAAACAKAVLRHTEDVRIVPRSVGDKDGIPELNYEAIIRWVEQRAAPAPLALRPLRAVTWASIGAAPPREWLVREWVPVGCVTLLTGRAGSGKSRLALQLSAGVAAGGGLWMPGTTAPAIAQVGPVLYASWEDDKFEYARRMAEISSSSANPWVTPDRLGDLHFADMAGHGPTWGPVGGKHISTVAQLLDAGQALRELATAVNPALVVIDPLAAAWRGNENDRSLVRDFMSNWDFWARETRTAVLIVAHPSKNPASNFSGSTDWEAAARSAINLANEKVGPAPQGRNAEDYRREAWQLSNSKANYGPQAHPLELKLTARGDADDDAAETRWECAGPWETRSEPTTTAGNGHGDDIDW